MRTRMRGRSLLFSHAFEQFHNEEFQGRMLAVNVARPKEERAPRWNGGSHGNSDA